MDPALLEARRKAAAGNDMNSQIQQAAAQEEQRKLARQEEEARKSLLVGLFSSDARARLGRISMLHPEKSRAIEDRVIQLAQQGRLPGEIQDKHVVDMLSDIERNSVQTKITVKKHINSQYKHRKTGESDDDEDLLEGL